MRVNSSSLVHAVHFISGFKWLCHLKKENGYLHYCRKRILLTKTNNYWIRKSRRESLKVNGSKRKISSAWIKLCTNYRMKSNKFIPTNLFPIFSIKCLHSSNPKFILLMRKQDTWDSRHDIWYQKSRKNTVYREKSLFRKLQASSLCKRDDY